MKVVLVASTQIHSPLWEDTPFEYDLYGSHVQGRDILAEFAGRACYQSWGRPNPKTATNEGYIANILDHRHYSVLEHASATFYVTGVSRSLTHELIRHRHFSYSQLSQRYVPDTGDFVVPPAFAELPEIERETLTRELAEAVAFSKTTYDGIVDALESHGFKHKEAREAARAALPNATETAIVVTGNMRAWREFIPKRYSSDADKEIKYFSEEVLRQLKQIAPNTFQDMELES